MNGYVKHGYHHTRHMQILLAFSLGFSALFLSGCATTGLPGNAATLPAWIADTPVPDNGLAPLTGKVYGRGKEHLVILLHGDVSGGGPADYFYDMAQAISRRDRSATVVALLRAGYYDRMTTVARALITNALINIPLSLIHI